MTFFHRLAGLVLLILGLVGGIRPTLAQQHPRLPSQEHAVQATDGISAQSLPSVDVAALRSEDRRRARQDLPHRYGTVLNAGFTPSRHGTWEQLPSGDLLWRLRIQSRDAVSMSIGFSRFDLPPGAEVYLHGPGDRVVHGPYTAADGTNGQHWTPLVRSSELIIELSVPADRRGEVDLTVGHVVHGYRSLPPSRPAKSTTKSGKCNIDVACDEADPWRNQVRSVGGYTLNRGMNALWCTGTLMNNTARDKTPYFLTAEHCVWTPSQASSMVFYWNFETAQCRDPGSEPSGTFPDDSLTVGGWDQTSSGAILRARYGGVHEFNGTISGKPDLTLVEIDDEIPPSYQLFFSGWSRADRAPDRSVTIHHPSGHGKRISFDDDPATITAYFEPGGGNTHLRVGAWDRGTTEPGSSGAPLFDTNQRVVGVLSGGTAACDGSGGAEDNNEPDWYGRLALGFENGDYQNATMADFLDPTDSGTTTLDGQNLISDAVPPARVQNFRVDEVTPDSVTLRWRAPGDDDLEGTASEYLLKYRSEAPITSREDFDRATQIDNVPPPKPAGTPQSTTFAVEEDTSYYFALVAFDKARNASPLASTDRDVTPVPALRVTTPPRPNPTPNRSTFRFVVEESQPVQVILYDALGRRLRTLYDDEPPPFQRQTVSTDLSRLASGMYFVRVRGQNAARTTKIVVVK